MDNNSSDKETVEALKKLLVLANQELVSSKEQIQKLSSELQKLKLDKKSKNERKKNKKKNGGGGAGAGPVSVSINANGGGLPVKQPVVNGHGGGWAAEEGGVTSAISIFPEEIWDKILGMITDWRDLWNCSKSDGLFDKLVSPTKTTWLFEKVFPHLYLYLERSEILNCRLVSKTWNEAVDTFLENHRSLRPHNHSCTDPIRPYLTTLMQPKRLGGNYVFGNSQMYQSMSLVPFFEDMMKDHPRNPFVGRAVTIAEYEDGELTNAQFWPTIYRFLRRWGKYIWYLTFHLYAPCNRLPPMQKLLKFLTTDLTRLCPELRRLRICGTVGQFEKWQEQQLELNPWTFPSRLETLQFDDAVYEEPNLLITTLLNRYNLLLRCLHLKAKTWNNVYKYQTRGGAKWEELTELHVEELASQEDFDTLLKMDVPNLRKLGLSLASTAEDWTFPKLLEVLHKVSRESYLHTLRFCGLIPTKLFETLGSELQAPPSLKTLELEHCGDVMDALTCYTFLVRFPFLETLNIFWRQGRDWNREVEMKCRSDVVLRPDFYFDHRPYKKFVADGGKEVVEVYKIIYGGKGDAYRSNIWEVLPRLKVLTCQGRVYTREGYEYVVKEASKNVENEEASAPELNGSTSSPASATPQQQPESNSSPVSSPSTAQIPSVAPLFSIGRSPGPPTHPVASRNITPAYRRNRNSGDQSQSQSSPTTQPPQKSPESPHSDSPPQKMQKSKQPRSEETPPNKAKKSREPCPESEELSPPHTGQNSTESRSGSTLTPPQTPPTPVAGAASAASNAIPRNEQQQPLRNPYRQPERNNKPQPSSQQPQSTGGGAPSAGAGRVNLLDLPTKPVVHCSPDNDPLALHQLVDILHGPPNPQMRARAMELLRTNPQLRSAFAGFMSNEDQREQQQQQPQPRQQKSRKKKSGK